MSKLLLKSVVAASALGLLASLSQAGVSITDTGSTICIQSDGLPDHATGQFPNRGNPHTMRRQNIRVCVDANPQKSSQPTEIERGAIGIGLNGVMFRPEAADYWDPNSRRGFSRRNSGWRLEPMGPKNIFGLDSNNAHVDRRGLYHYHGKPNGLLSYARGTHIGYSADGFEIHYVGENAETGWQLKRGNRPDGPGGLYDGTYVQDYEYVGHNGTLDRCNGGMLNGKYVYFLTDRFPFYPRCLWGRVADGFR